MVNQLVKVGDLIETTTLICGKQIGSKVIVASVFKTSIVVDFDDFKGVTIFPQEWKPLDKVNNRHEWEELFELK